jgi:hypothetical protein
MAKERYTKNAKASCQIYLKEENSLPKAKSKFVLQSSSLKDVAYHYTRQETATEVNHQESVKTVLHNSISTPYIWTPPQVHKEHS